jgi:NRPS condensation-like uncharacterized protein
MLETRAARDALLAKLLEQQGIKPSAGQKIHRRHIPDCRPLSFAQERLWFLDQLTPGNAVYNICRVGRVTGSLDEAALLRAFNDLVRRHEVLRSTFPAKDGRPVQAITPAVKLDIPIFDLQHLSRSAREAEAARIISEEARHSFNLARDPLLRVTLLRLETARHILILTVHQIICDGGSLPILFHELKNLYRAYSNGRVPILQQIR